MRPKVPMVRPRLTGGLHNLCLLHKYKLDPWSIEVEGLRARRRVREEDREGSSTHG